MSQGTCSLIDSVLHGSLPAVCIEPDGRIRAAATKPPLIVPGSFNPLHQGHRELGRAAALETRLPFAFELSVTNVDKPDLIVAEVWRRAGQFEWLAPVWITRAPLITQKACLFPGSVFALGIDTARRILDLRYYESDPQRLAHCLEEIRTQGCRFRVAGRHNAEGTFEELSALPVPPAFADLFAPISRQSFAIRVSSTELRKQ